jgi:hypothetical protein
MSHKACPFSGEPCPAVERYGGHYTDEHHLYYPRSFFKSQLEQDFRNLDVNKIDIPRCLHDAIHASGYLPNKPSRDAMLLALNGYDSAHEVERQTLLGNIVLYGLPEDAA